MKHYFLTVTILVLSIMLMSFIPEEQDIRIKRSLNEFPAKKNGWSGKEHPLDQNVLDVLKLDDYLNREYVNKDLESVSLYVGFYGSQKKGSTYHSPKNCLPGSGWQITDIQPYSITMGQSEAVVINRLIIQKAMSKLLVFYWYQDRGNIISSEYVAKLSLLRDSLFQHRSDGAMVRVIVGFSDSMEDAEETAVEFMKEFIPELDDFLPA